ncbi:MAG: DNA repair protein RadA [Candidatus Methylomirabilales bacterium]
MAKVRTYFECQQCGYQTPRWMGRCPECGSWGSLAEERSPAGAPQVGTRRSAVDPPIAITEVGGAALTRISTGLKEVDRTLGGGLVPGSVILIGGDPGIGKSTLLLQVAARIASGDQKGLYVSGEESAEQIRARAERIGAMSPHLYLTAETLLEAIIERAEQLKPDLLVLDSIQTTYATALESPPGSISQVREVASRLLTLSKERGMSTCLIGHVTKEGSFAGPKALEHIVDTVIYFEGDRQHAYRVLRVTKNRFGSTNEIGVFEMTEAGLQEIGNPSRIFLAERPEGMTGSVVVVTMEGTRPLLVEIQALVTPTHASFPRRVVTGADLHRVAILLAVLEKRLGMPLSTCDVFVNVAGGMRITEPAADLGIVAAVASSFRNTPLDSRMVCFGEVGLTGEIRAVRHAEKRLHEACQLGFIRCLLPETNDGRRGEGVGIEAIGLGTVEAVMAILFP